MLDIGCSEGELFQRFQATISDYVGLDPYLKQTTHNGNCALIRGSFPKDFPSEKGPFDCISALAVFEHIPPQEQQDFALSCAQLLKPAGYLIMTVPSPLVDPILDFLKAIRFIDGMALEEHYGFDIKNIPSVFSAHGLIMIKSRKFQLGLNNLFAFQKSAGN